MVKKVFGITVLACLGLAAVAGLNRSPVEAKAEPINTVDVFGTHNYFNGNAGDWGGNLEKDKVEDEITFNRLKNESGHDNCWIGMEKALHAGQYIFTAKMRVSAGFTNENIGFGFWAGDYGRIEEKVLTSQLAAGEWRDVECRYEFDEAHAVEIDSIHMWCLLSGGYIDFYDMQFRQLFVGNLGENLIKDVGFENVDLSGGDRTGWNDRHSGTIACAASQVLWTKEGSGDETNQFLRLRFTGGEGEVGFADFCSFFNDYSGGWPAGIPAGEYFVEMDVRRNSLFDTDNVGFAFFSRNESRIERDLTPQVRAATADEWTHVTYRYPSVGVELTQNYADGVDTIQLWANTKSVVGAQLDIDNVSVRKVTLAVDERPEFQGGVYSFAWVEADNADVVINVSDLHGYTDLVIKNGEYVLEAGADYTFAAGVLTIKKEFLADFDDGVAEFKAITSGGERGFTIEITHVQEDLPDIADYELEETVFGGDFMDLEVGHTLSMDQTEYAWGSVNLDDPGVVVAEGEGHALALKQVAGSGHSFSSAFVIFHPEKIVEHTIVTFSFDYKYNGANTDPGINVCFVGSSNVGYHLINLNGTKAVKTVEPAAKYRQWDVTHTDLANGYIHAEVSMRIDAATVTATNSIRFLMQHNSNVDQELRITNVSLKRWVKSLGTINPATGAFNKAQPADVVTNVKFAEGLTFYAVAIDSKTNYVGEANYTVANNTDGSITLTLKKEYLATLANGEHTFYVSSSENAAHEYAELELVVTVSGEAVAPDQGGTTPVTPEPQPEPQPEPEQPAKKGCKSSVLAASSLISTLALAGFGLLISKKRK